MDTQHSRVSSTSFLFRPPVRDREVTWLTQNDAKADSPLETITSPSCPFPSPNSTLRTKAVCFPLLTASEPRTEQVRYIKKQKKITILFAMDNYQYQLVPLKPRTSAPMAPQAGDSFQFNRTRSSKVLLVRIPHPLLLNRQQIFTRDCCERARNVNTVLFSLLVGL